MAQEPCRSLCTDDLRVSDPNSPRGFTFKRAWMPPGSTAPSFPRCMCACHTRAQLSSIRTIERRMLAL